jgi:stage V sporulation protein R
MIREEAYYFAPQAQTKTMNEGWATYWHSTIMTTRVLSPAEFIDYADHHSSTVATHPMRLNPYKLGLELFRDIEDRWNRGRFGKDYEECENLAQRESWDRGLGQGRDKLFLVRRVYNDVQFIDEFLTREFCERTGLFTYAYNDKRGMWEITSRDFAAIKEKLLFSLTNAGQPRIVVDNANHENRGELLLIHKHEGMDLDPGYGRDTLRNTQRIWTRPVHLLTRSEERSLLWTHDGEDFQEREIKEA